MPVRSVAKMGALGEAAARTRMFRRSIESLNRL